MRCCPRTTCSWVRSTATWRVHKRLRRAVARYGCDHRPVGCATRRIDPEDSLARRPRLGHARRAQVAVHPGCRRQGRATRIQDPNVELLVAADRRIDLDLFMERVRFAAALPNQLAANRHFIEQRLFGDLSQVVCQTQIEDSGSSRDDCECGARIPGGEQDCERRAAPFASRSSSGRISSGPGLREHSPLLERYAAASAKTGHPVCCAAAGGSRPPHSYHPRRSYSRRIRR